MTSTIQRPPVAGPRAAGPPGASLWKGILVAAGTAALAGVLTDAGPLARVSEVPLSWMLIPLVKGGFGEG